jgi:TonB family protein
VYDLISARSRPRGKDTTFATLTLRSVYLATLLRDGHLTHIRAVGGTRDDAFDAAVVHAIEALSASDLLPPPTAPAVTFRGDSLDLRILITPDTIEPPARAVTSPTAEGETPVLHLRLPVRRVTRPVRPKAGNRAPWYPEDLRRASVEGRTIFEFVVDADGRTDLTTVQVMSATAPQFIKAVLDALPELKFDPLHVEGCPVPVLVQMPFEFRLTGLTPH